MVYTTPARLKSPIKGPCEQIRIAKRPINIGANIEQKPWKPTVRKGDISAEPITGKPEYREIPPYLGPKVIDSRKKSAPAYSLGPKIIQKRAQAEVGPAKFDIRGFCNKGRQTAPAYTMTSRRSETKTFQAPPANKYHIGNAIRSTTKNTPTYSFGKKPVNLKTMTTPAPNVYDMPPVFGTATESRIKAAPAFTMLGRARKRQIPDIIYPGPGEYENNYRYLQKITPSYSMHIKHKVISDDHMKPGPAAHCPEKYFIHKSVPAPSFAIHHTPYLGTRKAYLIQEPRPSSLPEWSLCKKHLSGSY